MELDSTSTSGYDNTMADTRDWMTIEEALKHLGISKTALYRAIDTGKIERQIIGAGPMLRRSHILKYKPRQYSRKAQGDSESKPSKGRTSADAELTALRTLADRVRAARDFAEGQTGYCPAPWDENDPYGAMFNALAVVDKVQGHPVSVSEELEGPKGIEG